MRRNLSIFLGVSASLLVPLAVLAAAINATEDFGIILPSDSTTYTIKSGSTLNTVNVSGSTFILTLDPKDQTTITASGKQNLSNNANIQTTCSSDQSSIIFAVATSGSSMDFTVTPSGTCDVSTVAASSGGGGGGSGSGGSSGSSSSAPVSSSTPAPSTSPTASASPIPTATPAVLALVPTPPIVSAMPVLNVPMVVITRVLATGSKGEDVKALQMFLASDPKIYPEGIANGTFGPKTLVAVKRFQEKYGIAKKGQTGYGILGPKTRAKVKELSGASASASVLTQTASPAVSNIEAMQAQLKALQDMLKQLQKK